MRTSYYFLFLLVLLLGCRKEHLSTEKLTFKNFSVNKLATTGFDNTWPGSFENKIITSIQFKSCSSGLVFSSQDRICTFPAATSDTANIYLHVSYNDHSFELIGTNGIPSTYTWDNSLVNYFISGLIDNKGDYDYYRWLYDIRNKNIPNLATNTYTPSEYVRPNYPGIVAQPDSFINNSDILYEASSYMNDISDIGSYLIDFDLSKSITLSLYINTFALPGANRPWAYSNNTYMLPTCHIGLSQGTISKSFAWLPSETLTYSNQTTSTSIYKQSESKEYSSKITTSIPPTHVLPLMHYLLGYSYTTFDLWGYNNTFWALGAYGFGQDALPVSLLLEASNTYTNGLYLVNSWALNKNIMYISSSAIDRTGNVIPLDSN